MIRAHDYQGAAEPGLRVLTIPEAARELRCSRSHLCNLLSGKVSGMPPLPVFHVGRRAFIREPLLEA